jgi:hypothetical protein
MLMYDHTTVLAGEPKTLKRYRPMVKTGIRINVEIYALALIQNDMLSGILH